MDLQSTLNLAGTTLGFAGGLMMSAAYLSITRPGLLGWRALTVLFEVWVPGRGRTASVGAALNPANDRGILRGLGLVVLGFAVQALATFAP